LHVTPRAIAELVNRHGRDGGATVRLALQPGGCAGTRYVFAADAAGESDEKVFADSGLVVICDPATAAALAGLTVDFSAALVGGGFRFANPRARRTCACGSSFVPAD